ncbi:uncharacterized protein BKA78DRAFT_340323 [Phyllosticta capitalensis]|uniref:Uncharacterized protein n=1 Tax=Phyllosticta capitalensis TaxID=121624 RepID=A0ABR1Z4E4_9PEZI
MILLHTPTMTTSLALLPAPAAQPSTSTSSQSKQRPKLSLNTAQAQFRTFGKGSSLRLDTLSAVSPTIRNTFSNGYEPRPASASEPPSAKSWTADTPSSASTYNSTISTSSVSSLGLDSGRIPYSLPHNVKSILANSPLPPVVRHRTMKPMFPPAKRVSFAPFTEEIKTSKYTLAHSDIDSSSSTISSLSLDCHPSKIPEESKETETETEASQTMTLPSRTVSDSAQSPAKSTESSTKKAPSLGTNLTLPGRNCKRESPSDSESDGDECPVTPVAGRRKRRREWVWTLGPINGQKPAAEYVSEDLFNEDDPHNDNSFQTRPNDIGAEDTLASPASSEDSTMETR